MARENAEIRDIHVHRRPNERVVLHARDNDDFNQN